MNHSARQRPPIWRTPLGIVLLLASATGAYFLLTEHFDHVLQAVPYLILLACPLMHVFHHGHHGHQGHQGHQGHRDSPPPAPPAPGTEHPPR